MVATLKGWGGVGVQYKTTSQSPELFATPAILFHLWLTCTSCIIVWSNYSCTQTISNTLIFVTKQYHRIYNDYCYNFHSFRHLAEQRNASTGTLVIPFLSTAVTVADTLWRSRLAM